MAPRLALLIITLVLFFPGAAAASGGSCLHCHPGHHRELGSCVDCHGGEERTRRRDLAHHGLLPGSLAHFRLPQSPVTEAGTRLLETFACRRCHVSGGKGNRLASNLDRRAGRQPLELIPAIRRPVASMPDFLFTEEQSIELINALLLGTLKAEPASAEVPRVVHFEDGRDLRDNPFVKHCGACHRMLTHRYGGLGEGGAAPNLSGLFSEHFPATFGPEKLPWNPERLKHWLENPRKSRPLAQMRPIPLKAEEFDQLLPVMKDLP